jgi:hypothetical protein
MQVTALSAAAAAARVSEATTESRRDPATAQAAPTPSPQAPAAQRDAEGRAELLYLGQAHAVARLTSATPGAEPVEQLYRALAAGELNGTLIGPDGQPTGYWLQVLV